MLSRLNSRPGHYALLLLVGMFMFFVNLGGATLWDWDEGRNATCSYEMMEADNWIVPVFNGVLRTHKPALLYWFQIFSFQSFGVNEFAVRFPSAVAALLTVLLVYELGRSLFTPLTGLLSGMAVAINFMLGVAGRFANQDALLNLFTVMTFLIFWVGITKRGKNPFFWCGIAMGLGMLSKGLVGFVLPCAAIFLFLFWIRKLSLIWSTRLLLGVFSFLIVSLPWYILVSVETKGEFLEGFFLTHHFNRAMTPMEKHDGGPWYYLIVLLVGFVPWSIFFANTVWYGFWSAIGKPWTRFQSNWESASDRQISPVPEGTNQDLREYLNQPEFRYRFLWCWFLVYFLAFTVAATKLPNYILPVIAPISILTARFLDRWIRGEIILSHWMKGLVFGTLGIIGLGGFFVFLGFNSLMIIFKQEKLVFHGIHYLAFFSLPLAATAIFGFWYLRQNKTREFVTGLTISGLIFVGGLIAFGSQVFNQKKPPRPLVELTGSRNRNEDIRVINYDVAYLPSLNFYTRRMVYSTDHEGKALSYLDYDVPVFLYLPETRWRNLKDKLKSSCRVLGRYPDMYRQTTVFVITNR